LKVYPVGVQLIWPIAKRGRPRRRHIPDILSIPAEDMLADAKWQTVSWRTGTKGKLKARFAAVRVRIADGPPQRIRDKGQQHLPGDEAWLIGEHRASGEKKYYLANLPTATDLRSLAATIKARWICEQGHQQLKEELGLDHFEGRSWQGLQGHAARLIREARQLDQYGIGVSEPVLDYPRLLARVREVVKDARAHSSLRQQIDSLGVTVHEHAGVARFADEHTIETQDGLRLEAEKVIICTGGVSRRLSVPGFELASTHSDAWRLTSVPPSMLVVGAGATGVQVASIFNAYGSRIQLFQTAPRILPSEDEDVSAAVSAAFRESGIVVHENFGTIESFEKTPTGVRM